MPSGESTPYEPRKLAIEDIAQLPQWGAAALAARFALRVLPATGSRATFAFWGEDQKRYIRALEIAGLLPALSSMVEESVGKSLAAAAAATARAAATRAAAVAYDAAIIAKAAANAAAEATNAINTAAAAAAAAIAATNAINMAAATATATATATASEADVRTAAIRAAVRASTAAAYSDYLWLQNHFQGSADKLTAPLAFWERPLWGDLKLPAAWHEIMENWRQVLENIGLSEIYERHMQLVAGKSLEWSEVERLIIAWYEEYQAEKTEFQKRPPQKTEKRHEESSSQSPEERQVTETDEPQHDETKPAEASETSSPPKQKPEGMSSPLPFVDGAIASALADQPAAVDRLGRERLSTTLSLMFDSPNQAAPFTVAILGDWGAGKSTLKELIKKRLHVLAEKPKEPVQHEFVCAEFNAWEYEHTDNLHAGLAQEVVNGVTKKLGRIEKAKLIWQFASKEHQGELVVILFKLILAICSITAVSAVPYWISSPFIQQLFNVGFFVGAATLVATLWKQIKLVVEHPMAVELQTYLRLPSYHKHLGELAVIKQHLRTLCGLRLQKVDGGKPKRLIVFVDDLDRCHHECIVKTLDAIRLVMDIDQVITVLLVDHRIAMKAVAEQYKQLEDKGRDRYAIARDYLGKIIQLPVHLPRPHPDSLKDYIKEVLFPKASQNGNGLILEELPKNPKTGLDSDKPATSPLPREPKLEQPIASGPSVSDLPENPVTQPVSKDEGIPKPDGNPPPSPTPPTPVTTVEQQEIEKEMEDTLEDLNHFQELATVFELANPRQLLRLRNSYRLLKGLRHQQKEQKLTPTEGRELMTVLFWQEFLNQYPFEMKQRYEDALQKALASASNDVDSPETTLAQAMKWRIFIQGIGPERLHELKVLVSSVILPYYEGAPEPKETPEAKE